MCFVSVIGDAYQERWAPAPGFQIVSPVTREEFVALKREVESMRDQLRAAKLIDFLTGQPDCETADKMAVLRKVAELVGVDLSG